MLKILINSVPKVVKYFNAHQQTETTTNSSATNHHTCYALPNPSHCSRRITLLSPTFCSPSLPNMLYIPPLFSPNQLDYRQLPLNNLTLPVNIGVLQFGKQMEPNTMNCDDVNRYTTNIYHLKPHVSFLTKKRYTIAAIKIPIIV